MAILKVARLGHPVLRQPALPCRETIRVSGHPALIDDNGGDHARDNGAGLAAPQPLHVLKQIGVSWWKGRTAIPAIRGAEHPPHHSHQPRGDGPPEEMEEG